MKHQMPLTPVQVPNRKGYQQWYRCERCKSMFTDQHPTVWNPDIVCQPPKPPLTDQLLDAERRIREALAVPTNDYRKVDEVIEVQARHPREVIDEMRRILRGDDED